MEQNDSTPRNSVETWGFVGYARCFVKIVSCLKPFFISFRLFYQLKQLKQTSQVTMATHAVAFSHFTKKPQLRRTRGAMRNWCGPAAADGILRPGILPVTEEGRGGAATRECPSAPKTGGSTGRKPTDPRWTRTHATLHSNPLATPLC